MKRILITVLICFTLLQCDKEEDNVSKEFLEYYFEEYFAERHSASDDAKNVFPKIYALEYVDDDTRRRLINAVSKDTLYDLGSRGRGETFILTESERRTLIDSLNSSKERKLDNTFYKTVKVFSDDSLKSLLPGDDFLSWQKFRETNDYTCIYSFTRPIFLRDNTICFFYYSERCGDLCCEGDFLIYKKTWLGWKPYMSLYYWIS